MNSRARLVIVLLCTNLGACASLATNEANDGDPLEPLNRKIFAFNSVIDRAVIEPAARGYRALLPQFVRDRVRSIIDNLNEPLIFANNLLQLRIEAAGTTLGRFVTNSTVGLAGMFDQATAGGLLKQSGDFGQTLYKWGAGDGPYLVLPLLGPSNVRDGIGLGVDSILYPAGTIGSADNQRIFRITSTATDGIDLRERNIESLRAVEENSIDFYAALRNIVRQRRAAVLNEARKTEAIDDLIDPAPPRRN